MDRQADPSQLPPLVASMFIRRSAANPKLLFKRVYSKGLHAITFPVCDTYVIPP